MRSEITSNFSALLQEQHNQQLDKGQESIIPTFMISLNSVLLTPLQLHTLGPSSPQDLS